MDRIYLMSAINPFRFMFGRGQFHWLLYIVIFYIIGDVDLGNCLNHYVDSFETLSYRPVLDRRKRSLNDDVFSAPVNLHFHSHKRAFHIKLLPVDPYSSVFSENFNVDVDGVHLTDQLRPHDFLYEGYVADDPSSRVYGSLIDGIFDGHIILGDGESFTVEKAARYFDVDERPSNFHSIIYHDDNITHKKYPRPERNRQKRNVDDNHVDDDAEEIDSDSSGGCGLSDDIRKRMKRIQESALPLDDDIFLPKPKSVLQTHIEDENSSHHSFSFSGNGVRKRRDVPRSKLEPKIINGKRLYPVRTCSIYLQADQKLYESVFFKEGNRNPIRTREEIMGLFYSHIKAVNQIYESTDFGGVNALTFVIQRTSIFTNESCVNGKPVPGTDNPFCEDNVDVSNYLNLNSQRNHSAFCLAYAMTFRDFVGGTLGLAWVASPTFSTAGGICQMYQKYNEGQYGTAYRSLNTGIVTLVNYGNRVPLRVSQLTMAHEIGHNFGAPHDQTAECQPGLPDGNYIMFASATSGDKINNAKFSKCSVVSISQVLYEVLQQPPTDVHDLRMPTYMKKRNCFEERTSAFCGNQIREPEEQCDCGFSAADCKQMEDKCCNPREGPGIGCTRTARSVCSPSEGLCCNSATCGFYTAAERRLCREDSECLGSQYCDGMAAACPESKPKSDGLPCQDVTKVCHAGSCNGSICAKVGLKDCFLTDGKPSQLCHLACEKNGTCYSSFELPEFAAGEYTQTNRENLPGLLLHPGSPCNNYKGYCDIFRKCRSVDSNGPLARLKNLFFNKQTIKTVSQWVQVNWWACVIIGIGILLFMALFVKCCAVHTPSTNPNKMPAQNISDTLRHPGTLLRRGRGPTPRRTGAYSAGVGGPMTNAVPHLSSDLTAGNGNLRAAASNGRTGHHRGHHQRQQQHKTRRDSSNNNNRQQDRDRSSHNHPISSGGAQGAAASSRHQHHGAGNRAPPNLSAPPLIPPPPPPPTNTVILPPPQVFTNEPPPPYTPTDPAANIVEPSLAQPENGSTSALIGGGAGIVPVSLPGAPQPPAALPSVSSSSVSSSLPLVPGPPLPGQGPKPGRRRPKQPEQQKTKKGHVNPNKRAAK